MNRVLENTKYGTLIYLSPFFYLCFIFSPHVAASHKAEADKVKQVKAAEAEAEARYLSGLGVARQRKAIVHGLQESVGSFSSEVEGATPKDVMDILLLTQYFDTLASVGANSLIVEHDPSTVASLRHSVGTAFLTGGNK